MPFEVDEKVYAKVRGYSPWPARILDVYHPKSKNPRYLVYFYGTKQSATLKRQDVFPFFATHHKFGFPQKSRKNFKEAMEEIMGEFTESEKKELAKVKPKSAVPKKPVPSEKEGEAQPSHEPDVNEHNVVKENSDETKDSDAQVPLDVSRYGRKFKPKYFKESIDPSCISTSPATSDEEPDNEYYLVQVGPETVNVPTDAKTLSFFLTVGQLQEIEIGIRKSLPHVYPDLPRCVLLLDKLKKLKITPLMLKKVPDLVYTIRKIRRYFGIPPKNASPEEKLKFCERAEMIRGSAETIYAEFESLFQVPPGEVFFDYFERVRDVFYQEIRDKPLQEVLLMTDI